MREWTVGIVLLSLLLGAVPAFSQPASPAPAEAPRAAQPAFDPEAATEAWLSRLTPEQRERSDAYFEGGYWLMLWDLLYTLAVAGLLLGTGFSARLRDLAERRTRFRFLRLLFYGMAFLVLTELLTFPLTVYEDFFREHQYGMATQDFGGWLRDFLVGLALSAVFGGLAIAGLYTILRQTPRTWWIWGTAATLVFLVIGMLVAPVFIAPLFNTYTELEDPALRAPILSMARANGIPAEHVYVVDASRQTNRVSANVSGLGATLRISLNDNLLKRASPAGVEAVMGHEMGHYVLGHTYEGLIYMSLVFLVGFAFLNWAFGRVAGRGGGRWGIRGVDDVAGLPLMVALLSVYFLLASPVMNTIIRTNESEADLFGLNAARQPDGFAEVALMLSDYRKISPGPLEEWLFFDHPSGRTRILMAMRWKAEQMGESGAVRQPQP
ncbi:MAG TPA: M48 family metallopeptidase [Thermoanaerobaculia bacterium]|nr:M48 family metallopeptidase [Thermoanaerobaculia bacterium]